MWQRNQVVSISVRDGRFESDFQPCKVNLTHMFGTPSAYEHPINFTEQAAHAYERPINFSEFI